MNRLCAMVNRRHRLDSMFEFEVKKINFKTKTINKIIIGQSDFCLNHYLNGLLWGLFWPNRNPTARKAHRTVSMYVAQSRCNSM